MAALGFVGTIRLVSSLGFSAIGFLAGSGNKIIYFNFP
jgi:hypothetical protein